MATDAQQQQQQQPAGPQPGESGFLSAPGFETLADGSQQSPQQTDSVAQVPPAGDQQSPATGDDPRREALVAEARSYGIPDTQLQNASPEQIAQMMASHAQAMAGFAPQGMMPGSMPGQYPPMLQPQPWQQQNGFQQQPPAQQQQQQEYQPNWDDENIFDPEQAKAMKYLDNRLNQIQQMHQNYANDRELQEFNQAVDALQSDVIGTSMNRTPNQHQVLWQLAGMYDSIRARNPMMPVGAVVRLASRAITQQTSSEEALNQARQRNNQLTGTPQRTAGSEARTPEQFVQDKLNEFAAQPVTQPEFDPAEGFLD